MNLRENHLLALLSNKSLSRLAEELEFVDLRQGQVLHEPMQHIEHVHFLVSGFSSEIAMDKGGQRIEIGCVGSEGFTGVPAVLGVDRSPHRSFMESNGSAFRIETGRLLDAARADESLMRILLRYVHAFMIQVAATALADGR